MEMGLKVGRAEPDRGGKKSPSLTPLSQWGLVGALDQIQHALQPLAINEKAHLTLKWVWGWGWGMFVQK